MAFIFKVSTEAFIAVLLNTVPVHGGSCSTNGKDNEEMRPGYGFHNNKIQTGLAGTFIKERDKRQVSVLKVDRQNLERVEGGGWLKKAAVSRVETASLATSLA